MRVELVDGPMAGQVLITDLKRIDAAELRHGTHHFGGYYEPAPRETDTEPRPYRWVNPEEAARRLAEIRTEYEGLDPGRITARLLVALMQRYGLDEVSFAPHELIEADQQRVVVYDAGGELIIVRQVPDALVQAVRDSLDLTPDDPDYGETHV